MPEKHQLLQHGLISLDLSGNRLGDEGVIALAHALANDNWLRAVNLKATGHGGGSVTVELIRMLEDNPNLLRVEMDRVLATSVPPPPGSLGNTLRRGSNAGVANGNGNGNVSNGVAVFRPRFASEVTVAPSAG